MDSSSAEFQTSNVTFIEALRESNKVLFESVSAVIPGQSEKNILQRTFPRIFDKRSFISFGEVKRYMVVVEENCYVFADATDQAPLYTIPTRSKLYLLPEDPKRPHFRSHTVSPEANTGLARKANQSRRTLSTVLMVDDKGGIAFQFTFDKISSSEDVVDIFISAVEKSHRSSKVGNEKSS